MPIFTECFTGVMTIFNFHSLLPYATSVAKSLFSISDFRYGIAALKTLRDGFNTILNGPTGLSVLKSLRRKIIENWVVVENAVLQYTDGSLSYPGIFLIFGNTYVDRSAV